MMIGAAGLRHAAAAGPAASLGCTVDQTEMERNPVEQAALAQINGYRARHGLPALQVSATPIALSAWLVSATAA